MSTSYNPKIVTNNLLLNLDFKNPKRFLDDLGSGNLVQNFIYNASTWLNLYPANSTLTTGIAAPDGSTDAVRLSCNTTGNSLLRINFNSFTPNGTDSYAISFWVRKISGTTPSSLTSDVNDTNSYNYANDLIDGKWVRIVYTGVLTATAKTFLDLLSDNNNNYVLDFWGVKIENITASNNPYPVRDLVNNYTFNNYRPQYTTLDEDSITFTRTTSPAPKHGGLAYTTGTGSLTSSNFLYNDHTWEVWFRINDRNPEGSTNETISGLANYRGYHSGFQYSANNMHYYVWNGTTAAFVCNFTIGTSGTQIIQGQWYQIAVTRNGDVFNAFLNGEKISTTAFSTPTINTQISNDIHIGAVINAAAGASNYAYYAKNTISNMKMYNRALSIAEISKNYNALRGRYGI